MLKSRIILYITLFLVILIWSLFIVSFIIGDFYWIIKSGAEYNLARFAIIVISLCIPLYIIQNNN
jgi:hypothetical protein